MPYPRYNKIFGKKKSGENRRIAKIYRYNYSKPAKQAPATAVIKASPLGSLWKAPQPFVENKVVKLKYSQLLNMSITAGALQTHTFRLNSIYDPDFTGVGGQPRYYDQLFSATGPYLKYRVLGAKVRVEFVNDNTSATTISYGAIRVRDSEAAAIPVSDVTALRELPNTKYTILGITNASTGMKVLKGYYNIAKETGVKDIADNDNSTGPYGDNPTDLVYLDVMIVPLDNATTSSIYANVDIEYIVQCLDLNTVAAS